MIIAIDRKGAAMDKHAKVVCSHPHLTSPVKGEDCVLLIGILIAFRDLT